MKITIELSIEDKALIELIKSFNDDVNEETAEFMINKIKNKVVVDVQKSVLDVYKQICEKNAITSSIIKKF